MTYTTKMNQSTIDRDKTQDLTDNLKQMTNNEYNITVYQQLIKYLELRV